MKKLLILLAAVVAALCASAQVVPAKTTLAFSTAAELDRTGKVGSVVMGEGLFNYDFARGYVNFVEKNKPNELTIEVGEKVLPDFMIGDCVPFKVIASGVGSEYNIKSLMLEFDSLAAPSVHVVLKRLFGRAVVDGVWYRWKTKKYTIDYLRPERYGDTGSVTITKL